MNFNVFLLILGCLTKINGFKIPPRDYDNKNYFIVEIDTSQSNEPLSNFITRHKSVYDFEHQVRGFDDHFVFSIPKNHTHNSFLGNYNSNDGNQLVKREGFESEYDILTTDQSLKSIHLLEPKQLSKRLPVQILQSQDMPKARTFKAVDSSQIPIQDASEKLGINDPIFSQQWHLINANYPGNDVNVTGLWYEGVTGKGVVTAVIDDGLDYESEDLQDNFNLAGSWDFNDNTQFPKPRLFNDYHGTRCAGEIAAVKNDACGVGVAYDSQVSGVRILSGAITSEDEAAAMIYALDVNDIYSCSWGPTDDGKTLSAPEKIVKKAMIKGIQEGRDKKGSIYVFASGNGGRSEDSCNFDGYTNSIYSITVGAIDHKGEHPTYAEACSAVMVVTYSSGSGEHIHTTDIHGKCSAQHGGTSAAAPLAAGIFSLILQVNPNLTWRDLQYVAALSTVPVNEEDGHYQKTALGRLYSHKYGYGKIDAYQMAHFAKTWKNVKPQSWYYSDVIPVGESIKIDSPSSPEKSKIISSVLVVNHRELEVMNVHRIEHVTVTVNIKATFRGQVGIRLTSPFGVTSDLATFRPRDSSGEGFKDWTFSSVAHWGEEGIGEWTLEVINDPTTNGNEIEVVDWQLRFFGECADESKVEKYSIDEDYAQVRRDRLAEYLKGPSPDTTTKTTEAAKTTTTKEGEKEKPTTTTKAPEKEKPTTTATEKAKPTTTTTKADEKVKTTTAKAKPEPTETDSDSDSDDEKEDEGKSAYGSDNKGYYFMALVGVGFIIILMIMKYHKTPGSTRRRRREEFEFDIIPGEDYSDSEDISSHDSLDLGHRNDEGFNVNDERDRLYDEFNADNLPDYEDHDMFKIGDEEEQESSNHQANREAQSNTKQVNFKDSVDSLKPETTDKTGNAEEGKDSDATTPTP